MLHLVELLGLLGLELVVLEVLQQGRYVAGAMRVGTLGVL